MSDKKKPKGRKLKRISCRVCGTELNEQSYPDHLKYNHPDEDPRDRRVWGQKKLDLTSFQFKKKARVEFNDPGDEAQIDIDDPSPDSSLDEMVEVLNRGDRETEEHRQHEEEEEHHQHEEEEEKRPDIEYVNKQLDNILDTAEIEVDFSKCNSEIDELHVRLNVIKKQFDVKEKVEGLTAALEELKLVTKNDKDRDNELNHAEQKRQILLNARSIKEVTDKLPQFI